MTDPVSAVARVALEGDEDTVQEFLQDLGKNPLETVEALRRRRPRTADPHTLGLLEELARTIQRSGIEASQVRVALGTALRVRDVLGRAAERSVLVWTGPDVHESALRPTAQAIAELIDAATEQILVATYSIRQESSDPEQSLLTRLAHARMRGVGVTVVLHKDEANRRAFEGAWPVTAPRPRLLTWPIPDGDEMVKLHAKIAASDDRTLLITSANLTFHGLFANLELGVLIRGPIAGDVRRHFDRLERHDHLKEWSS